MAIFSNRRLIPAGETDQNKTMQKSASIASTHHHLPVGLKKPRSLSHRLVLENVVILFFSLLIGGSILYGLVSYYLLTNTDQLLQTEGQKLQSATNMWQAQGHALDENFLTYLVNRDQVDEFNSQPISVKLLDPRTGALLKRSANLEKTHLPLDMTDLQAAQQGNQALKTYQNSQGQEVRVLTLPLRDASQHTVVIAQVSLSLASVQQEQTLLALLLAGCVILGPLVAYSFALFMVKRELRPLALLSRTMSNVSTLDLQIPVFPEQGTSEIQWLAVAFNQMVRQLEAGFRRQENFVADISHELRTPLTSIRGQIDVLLLNPELSKEARQDLYAVQAELGRLSRLVANLLTNARAEIGILPQLSSAHKKRIDLDDLLFEVVRQIRFLNTRVTIAFTRIQECGVMGDRDLLKQLFLNLLDNAVTYTPLEGRVTLDLSCTNELAILPASLRGKSGQPAHWIRVAISNTGPGISEADLPYIFERHYRASPHVAAGKQRSGLGLSIALIIARAHGGTITAESRPGQETCFTVWLPALSNT